MSKLKKQVAAVWERFLALDKESDGTKQYLEKSPIEEAQKVLQEKFCLKRTTAYQVSTKIVRNMVEQRLIETICSGGPGNKVVAFKIINRNFVTHKTPEPSTARASHPLMPTENFETMIRRVVKSEFESQKAVIATDTIRKSKNIVVYIDTVNLNKACKEMGIMMPIEELLQELQRFGKVIQVFAFYNAGCPDRVLQIFMRYDCFLIGCFDNKTGIGSRYLDSLIQRNGSPLTGKKDDWIDSYIDRMVRANLETMDNADIHVIVSGDHHFDPVLSRIKQRGKKAIKCHADSRIKKVYFSGDCPMTQIRTRPLRKESFAIPTSP